MALLGKPLRKLFGRSNCVPLAGRLFLAVAMLGSALGSPRVQHAHAGGEKPHTHAGEHHHHQQAVDHDHEHLASGLNPAPVSHIHSSWFGIPITLPAPEGEDDSAQSESALVSSHADVQIAPASNEAPNPIVAIFAHAAVAHVALAPVRIQICSCRQIPILLCDTARHERSGVQLA